MGTPSPPLSWKSVMTLLKATVFRGLQLSVHSANLSVESVTHSVRRSCPCQALPVPIGTCLLNDTIQVHFVLNHGCSFWRQFEHIDQFTHHDTEFITVLYLAFLCSGDTERRLKGQIRLLPVFEQNVLMELSPCSLAYAVWWQCWILRQRPRDHNT